MVKPRLAIHNVADDFPVFAAGVNKLRRPDTFLDARKSDAGHGTLMAQKECRTNVV